MIRGEKFELDLDSDEEQDVRPAAFVGDVFEREPTAPQPPSAPTKTHSTGFPAHAKRHGDSRFKKTKHSIGRSPSSLTPSSNVPNIAAAPPVSSPSLGSDFRDDPKSWEQAEKSQIERENRQRLADMSPEEIEEERRELLSNLNPTMIQRLLQRANLDSGSNETDLNEPLAANLPPPEPLEPKSIKTVSFGEFPPAEEREDSTPSADETTSPDPLTYPSEEMHFPRASQPPDLDPSSETFLEDLHSKYFPSLPSDPSKLEWMQPTSNTTNTSSYNPSAAALHPKDLRFAFDGNLIPPRAAAEIPVNQGLHHHGDAPDAAGYTIPELAHLARSSFPAQRCIAFQTLGRILYRLGKGEFGNPSADVSASASGRRDPSDDDDENVHPEDSLPALARELWGEMDRLQVVQTLIQESEGKGVDGGRHVSAKAYATEAVWLWRKGGGRWWKAA